MTSLTNLIEKRDANGHRLFPNDALLWDEDCLMCSAVKMLDVWEEFLKITPNHIRITLNVKRLVYCIETMRRELVTSNKKV